jgi:hypothetical protein
MANVVKNYIGRVAEHPIEHAVSAGVGYAGGKYALEPLVGYISDKWSEFWLERKVKKEEKEQAVKAKAKTK